MTRFSATTTSTALISAPREQVWAALVDPVLVTRLTPLLRGIDVDGDTWVWHLVRISALGTSVTESFTEAMTFHEGRRIEYAHAPPAGVVERAGAEGWYQLDDHAGADGVTRGTRLGIELTITIDLPLPRAMGGAVRRVMSTLMNRTGERFAENLLHHLGARRLAA